LTHPSLLPVRPEWLDLVREAPLEPDLPIVDAHHHLMRHGPYLSNEFRRDIAESGHKVAATVHVDARLDYLTTGPEELRPIGETVSVLQQVRPRSDSPARLGLGLVGYTDLRLGRAAKAVLEAHCEAGEGRFRGVRQISPWDADASLTPAFIQAPPPGLLADARFRKGFACLGELGLSFDSWVYSPQLPEVIDLADAFPDVTIVLDHCGTPLAEGAYAARRAEALGAWRAGLRELARRPNVYCKLGGLAKWLTGSEFHLQPTPPASEDLAAAWGPIFASCVDAFGTGRCMFESNFPIEKATCSYGVLWNAFKRFSAGMSESERTDLFTGAACCAYRLDLN
jgi:predicted TIM-barrel fold metal-dependent hydrolase